MLIGLLSLFGASLVASGTPVTIKNLLEDALKNPADEAKAAAFTHEIVTKKLDIDKAKFSNKKSIGAFIADQFAGAKDAVLLARLEGFLKTVQQYRSKPTEAHDLHSFIAEALADSAKLPDLEAFLKDKSFNIDIIQDPTTKQIKTIGKELDSKKLDVVNARKILKLERIKLFRTAAVDPLDALRDSLEDTLADDKKIATFAAVYTDIISKYPAFDIDNEPMTSTQSIGKIIEGALEQNDINAGALQIAELVQAERTHKDDTVRALFRAFERDAKNADHLNAWVSKYKVDVDQIVYDINDAALPKVGAKLDHRLGSTDAKIKAAATLVAEKVRPYRAAEIKVFREKLAAAQKDKTQIADLKAWSEKHLFDIDSVLVDPAQPKGKTLGDSVNELKDDSLSALFKDKRSNAPRASNWLTSKKFIAGVAIAAATSLYLWQKHTIKKAEQATQKQLPVLS